MFTVMPQYFPNEIYMHVHIGLIPYCAAPLRTGWLGPYSVVNTSYNGWYRWTPEAKSLPVKLQWEDVGSFERYDIMENLPQWDLTTYKLISPLKLELTVALKKNAACFVRRYGNRGKGIIFQNLKSHAYFSVCESDVHWSKKLSTYWHVRTIPYVSV